MNKLFTLFILLVFISSCNTPEKKENIEKDPLFKLFANAPTSLFDQTSEGISNDEKNDLIEKGESEYWKISHKSPEKIIVTCKIPSSEITMFLIDRTNKSPVLLANTENEQASTIQIWSTQDNGKIEPINLLPNIRAQDFYVDKNSFGNISNFDNNVYFSLKKDSDSLYINAHLNTAMEPIFEDHPLEYTISLGWNGSEFTVAKTPIIFETITVVEEPRFDSTSCNFPNEFVIHPPKKEGSYELGVQDTRFFPIGMSDKGVFAYFSFRGEMDPCECVQANLILFSTEQDTVLNSFLFSTDTEDGSMDGWEEFTDPKKIWETEIEMYCSILEDEKIVSTEYDVIDGEELMTIFHLVSTPTEDESMSMLPTIKYSIFDEDGEVVAQSGKLTQITSANLVAMLRYKVGDDYFFVQVIATKEAGYEGATLREYDIH